MPRIVEVIDSAKILIFRLSNIPSVWMSQEPSRERPILATPAATTRNVSPEPQGESSEQPGARRSRVIRIGGRLVDVVHEDEFFDDFPDSLYS